ncbi:ATP-binding protein [Streptomyces sp. TLI_105]|uniref:ATP-binding protein n=1 Tax=Streptomyces sp. TLI_105 TaxID=1881019 RepID=UPI00089C5AB2|nr:ATP-binding protein [Streptomyces sp. TLI_105]SEB96492.1 Histidine kinase-like ATPase domain-containing protein [Streptomyces sp. TLI_105]
MTGPPIRHATTRTRRYELAGGDGVVRECRDLAQRALSEWFGAAGEPGRVPVEDTLLLVSEVVTNAFTHGGVPYELRLDGADGRLWVQVSDTSPARPRPHGRHRPSLPSGHGLYLLERLAAAWGCVPRARGKAVWFEVEVTARPDERDPA